MESKILDNVFCVPFEHGQKKAGLKGGASNALSMFMISQEHAKYHSSIYPTSNTFKKSDYQKLFNVLVSKNKYVLIGGDHSVGHSSVASSMKKIESEDLYVIWIDAHPDTNTYSSSMSKNHHGMPLAGLLGFEESWVEIDNKLDTEHLLYYGIRDIDPFEKEMIEKYNIYNTRIYDELIEKIDNIIQNNKNATFHISWDVDSLDPKYLDSTGCPVEDGLTPDDIINIVNYLSDRIIALDIVEYNPSIGNAIKSNDTLKYIMSGWNFI